MGGELSIERVGAAAWRCNSVMPCDPARVPPQSADLAPSPCLLPPMLLVRSPHSTVDTVPAPGDITRAIPLRERAAAAPTGMSGHVEQTTDHVGSVRR